MTKVQLLKEILQRAGDPNAESDTFRSLAWSLFLESLYEQADNLRLVEDKSLVKTVTLAVITGLNGVGLVNERSGFFDTIAEIKDIFILNDSHNIPVARASDEEYRLMLSNPFYMPAGDEFFYYYTFSKLYILTGQPLATLQVTVSYYPDFRTIMDTLSGDTATIPIHNSFISKLIPVVAAKLKAELGLVL